MAIVNMGSHSSVFEGNIGLLEGAYSPLSSYAGVYDGKPCSYFLYETDHGCCIKEEERNGYDDSDFMMLVWNPETKSASWICFATTRGWSYPCYASRPDATPEVLEAYYKWENERRLQWERERKAKALCSLRKRNASDRAIARFYGVDVNQVRKLYNFYSPDFVETLYKFLGSNLRSEFRKSLRKQLITWLEGRGKFDKPFSPKQVQYI